MLPFTNKRQTLVPFISSVLFIVLLSYVYWSHLASGDTLVHEHRTCVSAVSMEQAGRSTGTDKVLRHGYHRYVQPYLTLLCTLWEKRGETPALLEIGINSGKSLGMWTASMPGWYVYGMDISVRLEKPGLTVFQADQSSLDDIRKVFNSISHPVPMINDDGSHIPEHQLLTFNFFFENLLQPGGVYVLEDIETSYWTGGSLYGYKTPFGFGHAKSAVEIFKKAADIVNREFLLPTSLDVLLKETGNCNNDEGVQTTRIKTGLQKGYCHGIWPRALGLISSVTFGKNLIIITKKSASDQEYDRAWNEYPMLPWLSKDPSDA